MLFQKLIIALRNERYHQSKLVPTIRNARHVFSKIRQRLRHEAATEMVNIAYLLGPLQTVVARILIPLEAPAKARKPAC